MSIPGQIEAFETGVCERIITAKYHPVPTTKDVNNVYVNTSTGSDQWPGTGASDAPYASIARAIKDLGNLGNLDIGRIILQNAGPHIIPEDYVFPAQTYSDRETDGTAVGAGFTEQAPLIITAAPTLTLNIPALNIVAQNLQATSNLVSVVTNLVLVPGALAGLWVLDANGAKAAILDNDATTLEVAHSGALTAPLVVYSRLATIDPANALSTVPTLWFRGNSLVILQGVLVNETAGGALKVDSGAKVHAIACELDSVVVGDSETGSPGFFVAEACLLDDFTGLAGRAELYRSVQDTGSVTGIRGFSGIARQCIFETCATGIFATTTESADSILAVNSELRDTTVRGFLIVGTIAQLTNVLILAANTAGVQVTMNGLAQLTTVSGANSTNGIQCLSGGKAIIAADVDISGAAGADFVVEGLAAVAVANFRGGTAPFSIKGPGGSAIIQGTDSGNARRKAILTTTTPYNLTGADDFVGVDATAGAKVVNLPDIANNRGREFTVQKTDASGNAVTVTPAGGNTLGGAGALAAQFSSMTVIAPETGTVWFIIARI